MNYSLLVAGVRSKTTLGFFSPARLSSQLFLILSSPPPPPEKFFPSHVFTCYCQFAHGDRQLDSHFLQWPCCSTHVLTWSHEGSPMKHLDGTRMFSESVLNVVEQHTIVLCIGCLVSKTIANFIRCGGGGGNAVYGAHRRRGRRLL